MRSCCSPTCAASPAFPSSWSRQQVVPLLNEYFSLLTEITFRHEGTVFHMAGDCLMLGFGVPLEQPDSPQRAVRAAREMLIRASGSWRAVEGAPPGRGGARDRHQRGRRGGRQHRLGLVHELHHHRRHGEHRRAALPAGARRARCFSRAPSSVPRCPRRGRRRNSPAPPAAARPIAPDRYLLRARGRRACRCRGAGCSLKRATDRGTLKCHPCRPPVRLSPMSSLLHPPMPTQRIPRLRWHQLYGSAAALALAEAGRGPPAVRADRRCGARARAAVRGGALLRRRVRCRCCGCRTGKCCRTTCSRRTRTSSPSDCKHSSSCRRRARLADRRGRHAHAAPAAAPLRAGAGLRAE